MGDKTEKKWPVIGIDLGTTYSCVGVWQPQHGRVEIITNNLGNRTTPSWVAFNQHERLIGEAAKNQFAGNSTNTIFDAKRLIGKKFNDATVLKDTKLWPFKVVATPDPDGGKKPMIAVTFKGEEKQFSAEEISSMILAKMKEAAETFLGSKVNGAVVTVPAYFNNAQRQATKDAGEIAGLDVMRIINEPTAAAIAYGLDKKVSVGDISRKNILVFDLGGGTFDVSLVAMENNIFEVKAVSGDTHLGGRDFDNRLVSHFVAEFERKHDKNISGHSRAIARLSAACEKAKRLLSSTVETAVEIDCLFEGIDFSSTISRAKFEKLNMDYFSDCITPVEKCLSDANIGKKDVDDVVLVGGSTRIPKIQQLLREFFQGKELCNNINPDEAVAYGASFHAAMLAGVDSYRQNTVLVDVAPLSLGIESLNDVMSVVVPRNTTLPTKMNKPFTTVNDNQSVISFPVYEGESPIASRNNFLGEFKLYNIPPAPGGVPSFDVCFNIDDDGILTVSAELRGSENKDKITLTNHTGRLTREEIEKMTEAAEKFKAEEEERKKAFEAKNVLESYLNKIEKTLRSSGRKIGKKDKKKLSNIIEQITQWLDWNYLLFDVGKVEEKIEEAKSICEPIIEKMH